MFLNPLPCPFWMCIFNYFLIVFARAIHITLKQGMTMTIHERKKRIEELQSEMESSRLNKPGFITLLDVGGIVTLAILIANVF